MLKIGLTGNIGSGKSIVSRIFSVLGIPVYHADDESRKFLDHPDVISGIVALFGAGILNSSNQIDKAKLGRRVFPEEGALRSLNAILHPLVMNDFSEWCKTKANQPYILQEAAIIFEGGYDKYFDKTIHVSCPEEIAVARVMLRDRVKREDVMMRMRHQIENSKKSLLADYVILNDGSGLVIPQVLSVHKLLLQVS